MTRNPILTFHGVQFKFIGDVHAGKKFRTYQSKRQLREDMLYDELIRQLKDGERCKYTIIVGDLFDSFRVSNEAVKRVYDILTTNGKNVIVIPGNHDIANDKTRVSSYDILAEMLKGSKVDVVTKSKVIELNNISIYLDAYNPFAKSAIRFDKNKPLLLVGHWDDPRIKSSKRPLALDHAEVVVSGHIHKPERFLFKGVDWVYTGAIQPLAHDEDPEGDIYVTLEYTEMDKVIRSDTLMEEMGFPKKHVRINCYPGYSLPVDIDCISLTYNPIYQEETKDVIEDVTDFSTKYLLKLKTAHDMDDELLVKLHSFLTEEEQCLEL